MSASINASATAQAVARAGYDKDRYQLAAPPASDSQSAASAPEREAALARQLEEHLNTEIARIRKRVDPEDASPSPSGSTGRILDIRA